MERGSLLFSQPCILKTNLCIPTGLYRLLVNTVVYRAAEAREKYCEFSLKVAQACYQSTLRAILLLSVSQHGPLVCETVYTS